METDVKYNIPLPLQQEHLALHEQLQQATQAPGAIGEAAREVAKLMHPHFVKEDRIAMPPLSLLARLAQGEASPDMLGVLDLTDQLQADWTLMLAEHQHILAAVQRLREAAQRAGRDDIIDFAEQLMRHARTEEAVMYPAAILVGELVRQRLGLRAAQGA